MKRLLDVVGDEVDHAVLTAGGDAPRRRDGERPPRPAADLDDAPLPESGEQPATKMGFAGLARAVASKWKVLDPSEKESLVQRSQVEKQRYKKPSVKKKEKRLRAQRLRQREQQKRLRAKERRYRNNK